MFYCIKGLHVCFPFLICSIPRNGDAVHVGEAFFGCRMGSETVGMELMPWTTDLKVKYNKQAKRIGI